MGLFYSSVYNDTVIVTTVEKINKYTLMDNSRAKMHVNIKHHR